MKRLIMKTIKRNISYNKACSILENNYYGVTSTRHNSGLDVTCFFNNSGLMVARYFEKYGKLQVLREV